MRPYEAHQASQCFPNFLSDSPSAHQVGSTFVFLRGVGYTSMAIDLAQRHDEAADGWDEQYTINRTRCPELNESKDDHYWVLIMHAAVCLRDLGLGTQSDCKTFE